MTEQQFLMELGFTEQRAGYISKKINRSPFRDNHISTLDFAHIFIRALFKYDLLLTDQISNLPQQSENFNVGYTVDGCGNEGPPRKIVCQNFNQTDNLDEELGRFFFGNLGQQRQAEDSEEKDFSYWYHGTDCSSASAIVEIGIDEEKGTEKRDFSDGKGFYLSDNFERAKQWALDRGVMGGFSAILRYKIPKNCLKDGIVLSKDRPEDMEVWKDIIRHCRSGKKQKREMKSKLAKASFIIGPLSRDGAFKNDANWPKLLSENWLQLCIRNSILAAELNLVLDKIAFIKKNERRQLQQY